MSVTVMPDLNAIEASVNVEAEQAVLGCVLIDGRIIERALQSITGAEFWVDGHRAIWDAMVALHRDRRPIDVLSVLETLAPSGGTGVTSNTLLSIMDAPSTVQNIEYYCSVVCERYARRQLVETAAMLARLASDRGSDTLKAMDTAVAMIERARPKSGTPDTTSLAAGLDGVLDALEERMQFPDRLRGFATGFNELDYLCGGLQCGELTVLAARPAMGKTALGAQIALNTARATGKTALIYSLEMRHELIVQRLLAAKAQVPVQDLVRCLMLPSAWQAVATAATDLREAPLYVIDTRVQTIRSIQLSIQAIKASGADLGVVVIDYLQLIRGVGKHATRQEEIAEIAASLKTLAIQEHVPVLALAQVGRTVETRADKRPMLSDLRESGTIEAEADVVTMIYRDEYYHPDPERAPNVPEVVELIVGKNRNGATGIARCAFLPRCAAFYDVSYAQEDT